MSEIKGISILIPVYNFDIRPLVDQLCREADTLPIPFEIRCYDDFSNEDFKNINREVIGKKGVVYLELEKNTGRSQIRNKLAREASYPLLLFLDSDSSVIGPHFIRKYIGEYRENYVIAGGTVYDDNYNPNFSLRYKYGRKREQINPERRNKKPYNYINLNNLFISKEIYLSNTLDESIKTYGHEDTKFAEGLRRKKINIIHIANPVLHSGIENNKIFIEKSREAIRNFYKIISEGYGHHSRLYKYYSLINKLFLKSAFIFFFGMFEKRIVKNLHSAKPSLFLFDLFKLNLLLREGNER
jgi:glycosyltransferase involved in cell wall biosynthesis